MSRLRRIGALFSQDAFGYWRALYVLLLVVWSVSTIWRVASGSLLETPDTSPTLINRYSPYGQSPSSKGNPNEMVAS